MCKKQIPVLNFLKVFEEFEWLVCIIVSVCLPEVTFKSQVFRTFSQVEGFNT